MSPMREMLLQAVAEIRDLRRRNEVLAAKVEMIDLFACVLHTSPATRSVGAAPDIAWQMEREAARLEIEENAPEAANQAGFSSLGGNGEGLRPGNR